MPRKATGQVIEPTDGRGWAIRFRAYGKRRYVTLGTVEEGWNRRCAEAELRHLLADVERGIWRPYEPPPAPEVREAPTFHELASEWMENREPELRPKTVTSYRWMLSGHLLPHFARMRLDRIGSEDVDRYKAAKLREAARKLRPLLAIMAGAGLRNGEACGSVPRRRRPESAKSIFPMPFAAS